MVEGKLQEDQINATQMYKFKCPKYKFPDFFAVLSEL